VFVRRVFRNEWAGFAQAIGLVFVGGGVALFAITGRVGIPVTGPVAGPLWFGVWGAVEILCLVSVVGSLRQRVVVGEDGLRVWHILTRRFIPWADVRDISVRGCWSRSGTRWMATVLLPAGDRLVPLQATYNASRAAARRTAAEIRSYGPPGVARSTGVALPPIPAPGARLVLRAWPVPRLPARLVVDSTGFRLRRKGKHHPWRDIARLDVADGTNVRLTRRRMHVNAVTTRGDVVPLWATWGGADRAARRMAVVLAYTPATLRPRAAGGAVAPGTPAPLARQRLSR
jgi:hypothetical protein